jgi:hypothetical protein
MFDSPNQIVLSSSSTFFFKKFILAHNDIYL